MILSSLPAVGIGAETCGRRTKVLVDNAIAMGVSHITIHGRTRHQASTEPVNLPELQTTVEYINNRVPTIANGDLWTLDDARKMRATGVNGVMAARGLLAKFVFIFTTQYTECAIVRVFSQVLMSPVQRSLPGTIKRPVMPLSSLSTSHSTMASSTPFCQSPVFRDEDGPDFFPVRNILLICSNRDSRNRREYSSTRSLVLLPPSITWAMWLQSISCPAEARSGMQGGEGVYCLKPLRSIRWFWNQELEPLRPVVYKYVIGRKLTRPTSRRRSCRSAILRIIAPAARIVALAKAWSTRWTR